LQPLYVGNSVSYWQKNPEGLEDLKCEAAGIRTVFPVSTLTPNLWCFFAGKKKSSRWELLFLQAIGRN